MSKQLLNLVCGKIHEMRKKELNYNEVKYVMNKIKTISPGIFTGRKLEDVVPVIAKVYMEDLKKLDTYNTQDTLDVHEYLVNSVSDKRGEPVMTLDSLLQNPKELQAIVNPKALIKKTYLVLDRRYQSAEGDNRKLFTWNVVTASGSFDKYSSAVNTIEIKNIIGIRLFPFRFPNTPKVFGADNTLSVEIIELNNQGYVAPAFYKRFHFSFNIFRQNPLFGVLPTGTQEPFKTAEIGDKGSAVVKFREPIAKLDNISIRFGNPFNTLTLDADKLPATVSAVGAQTLIDFGSVQHYCAVGDSITFKEFNTTNPTADHNTIVSANDDDGWYITALTTTTITIDMDLSGLSGAISSNPTLILLNAKRFILRLEIDYFD